MMLCTIGNVQIDAVATYLPPNVRTFEKYRSELGDKAVDLTVRNSGIRSLRIAGDTQTSVDMCFEAASHMFAKSGIQKSEIDAVVMVSQTFDYLGPASSIILQDKLGISKEAVCFDIIYGCSGYIYGLFQAALLLHSGACRKVLLLNGETNSRLMDESVKEQYMVFGDAASATIISKGSSSILFHIASDGGRHGCVVNYANGFRTPILEMQGALPLGPSGQFLKASNDGMAVFDFIIHEGASSIRTISEYSRWQLSEIDFFALHQATEVTLGFLTRRLGVSSDSAPFVSQHFGNTSSVTIPLVLTSCASGGRYKPNSWKKVIMGAFGLGLSWGSVACDLSATKFYGPLNLNL